MSYEDTVRVADLKTRDTRFARVRDEVKVGDARLLVDGPAVALAKQVGEAGSTYPAVFNAANEQAVLAFHAGSIRYLQILDTVRAVVDAHTADQLTLESVLEAERWARAEADRLLTV